MDGGLENMWFMDSGWSCLMTGVIIWFSNLTHLLSWVWLLWDLACFFLCAWRVDSYEIWLVVILCACLVLMVIAFLIACSLMSPSEIWWISWLLFIWVGMSSWTCSRASMLVTILFLWCFFWFFLWWSLKSLLQFCSNDHSCSFLWAYISRHASYGDSMSSFMNQILHLLTLMISWVYLCCIQVLCSQVFID
jgi:hypothetical protein